MNPEEADPPRRTYGFKPTRYEVVNNQGNTPGSAGPIDIHELHRQATPPVMSPRPVPSENEVHAILRENLAKANAAGLNDLNEKPHRISRRKRDYWISMAAVNLVFIPLIFAGFSSRNAIVFVSAIAGFAMLNAALAWVFWAILDDY